MKKGLDIVELGLLLLAEPFMLDQNFKRSVVMICDHHPEGTLGFILNKPLNIQINELLTDFPEMESEVYFGGPVQTDTVHFLHRAGDLLEGSHKVMDGLYWGGDFEQLKVLISNKLINRRDIKFFVGYTGWSAGQLEEELRMKSWILAEGDKNYVFKGKSKLLWEKVLQNKGNLFSVIAGMPDNISMN